MATKAEARKAEMALLARRSYEVGALEEAMKALGTLKTARDNTADDVAWVVANEALLKKAPAAPKAPDAFFPRIRDVKWRVDVTISTSSLERVMRPSVMMELTLDDGNVQNFEMPLDQLHKLRYSLAKVLRSMQEIERNPIMRLIDESNK
mmetsp:Transcript_21832/g.70284  ORF Transcript_21832/g.70284 Transcript_21832/m.70284 type:complete len:150 (+) Transcript_21832:65-514(+)|eukprot:CAMPEP_0118914640 /NCGR_PEP_ID=MMETSP1166-20130328/14973_1 /TAXON_ID=1104430 /ORGANISM="Chrysoreinhardia sp, Strain CCMP3193" /LENGTH=149 /DNA_ID=CAMNT_0006854245 /DNA_START=96 /DNA_END=545 /DNA_ORIENTATION=+